jgi:hypothetical protein
MQIPVTVTLLVLIKTTVSTMGMRIATHIKPLHFSATVRVRKFPNLHPYLHWQAPHPQLQPVVALHKLPPQLLRAVLLVGTPTWIFELLEVMLSVIVIEAVDTFVTERVRCLQLNLQLFHSVLATVLRQVLPVTHTVETQEITCFHP